MRIHNYGLIAFLLCQAILASQAFADDQPEVAAPDNKVSGYVRPHLGLIAGVNNVTGGPFFTYGGEAGVHISDWDIGMFVNTVSNSTTVSGLVASGNATFVMLSLTGQKGIFYGGGRFGLGIRSVSVTSASSGASLSASGSAFAVGPVIGVRIPIANNISANFETSWQVIYSGDVSGTLGTATLTSAGYLTPLAGVRVSF